MAYADNNVDDSERELILKKMKKVFPHESDYPGKYEAAKKEYETVDSSDIDAVIRDNFKQFSNISFSQKYRIFSDLYDIINADGVVDESETEAVEKLKKIINYEVESN